jgi:hypothetical protein
MCKSPLGPQVDLCFRVSILFSIHLLLSLTSVIGMSAGGLTRRRIRRYQVELGSLVLSR